MFIAMLFQFDLPNLNNVGLIIKYNNMSLLNALIRPTNFFALSSDI